jgi:hypothetical protein
MTLEFNQDDTNIGTNATQAIVEAGDANSTHLNCPAGTWRRDDRSHE